MLKHLFLLSFLFFSSISLGIQCPSGFYKVIAHPRQAYYRSDGTFVRATSVKESCREYTAAYKFLKDRIKIGPPPSWPHKKEKFVKWNEDQKNRVIEAFEEIPEILLSDSCKGIYRASKSHDFPNPASNGDGHLVLYDSAFDLTRKLSRVIAHELAHEMYRIFSKKEKLDYSLKSGWNTEIEKNGLVFWKPRNDAANVEPDSKVSREEDFANNIEYFLFQPDLLQKKSPQAYQWIKDKFGDKLKLRGNK